MTKTKELYEAIATCDICEGKGISNYWVAPDGDYDFEWCECNPEHLSVDEDYPDTMSDTCIGCNENRVSMTELYCLNCYLERNSEIDYTQIDQLWLTQENN